MNFLRYATVAVSMAAFCSASLAQKAMQKLGKGEGQVDIVAWAGYIEHGATDKSFDWVTDFEKASGCKVNVKTAGTSDEMVALMNEGGFDLVTASVAGSNCMLGLSGSCARSAAGAAGLAKSQRCITGCRSLA